MAGVMLEKGFKISFRFDWGIATNFVYNPSSSWELGACDQIWQFIGL